MKNFKRPVFSLRSFELSTSLPPVSNLGNKALPGPNLLFISIFFALVWYKKKKRKHRTQ